MRKEMGLDGAAVPSEDALRSLMLARSKDRFSSMMQKCVCRLMQRAVAHHGEQSGGQVCRTTETQVEAAVHDECYANDTTAPVLSAGALRISGVLEGGSTGRGED
jgi:hypothetical protein